LKGLRERLRKRLDRLIVDLHVYFWLITRQRPKALPGFDAVKFVAEGRDRFWNRDDEPCQASEST
jgi:hypothetical protein